MLFFRGESRKLLAEKDLSLDFFSPLLNLCFVILQWPRGEIKQFSFKNNCLIVLYRKKKALCVGFFFIVLFVWFCFSVQLYFHKIEAYLFYPTHFSIRRVSLCSPECSGTCYVEPASLQLTEIHLSLPPKCWY